MRAIGLSRTGISSRANEPSIDWLLENQEKIVHKYYTMGLEGKI